MYATSSRSSSSSLAAAWRVSQGRRLANTSFMRPLWSTRRTASTSVRPKQNVAHHPRRIPRDWRFRKTITVHLARQLHIPQAFADDTAHNFNKPASVVVFALVEAKRLLVQISEQMKRFDRNIRAFDASLEQRPKVFQAVSVNVSLRVALRVIYHLMHVFIRQSVVRGQRIGENLRAFFYVLSHSYFDLAAAYILYNFATNARNFVGRIAFQKSKNSGLAHRSPSRLFALLFVHKSSASTDKRFVGLNTAFHFRGDSVLHRQADAMQHEPSRFLCDADVFRQLVRTDAIFAVGDQPKSAEPFVDSDGRIFQNRSDLDRKLPLLMRVFAFPNPARGQKRNVRRSAGRAFYNAVRPANRLHKIQRPIIVREVLNRVVERLGKGSFLRFHKP